MSARAAEPLRIPAFAAYCEPDADAVEVSERAGIARWSDPRQAVVWYGRLSAGAAHVRVRLRLPERATSRLRLTVGREKREASPGEPGPDGMRTADFGAWNLPSPGYVRVALEGVARSGAVFGDLDALVLEGPATVGAHFNVKERRNAASVHLGYPVARDARVAAFTNEMTPVTDPLWSYYMACGWHRGYFGIQVNSPTERRIIFSVWDSGDEAVDRSKVARENRVELLAKGEKVVAEGFGNEGTGGHSHLVHPWRLGDTFKFLVTAEPDAGRTVYTGWFWFAERRAWGLIARFRAPKDGAYLKGLYSFNENFWGANGQARRLCEFGPAWVRDPEGTWRELTDARFTHDPTGREDRRDYDAGVARSGRFFLSNGGFLADSPVRFGDTFTRKPSGKAPEITLPKTASGG